MDYPQALGAFLSSGCWEQLAGPMGKQLADEEAKCFNRFSI